jgi:hypothetical protein
MIMEVDDDEAPTQGNVERPQMRYSTTFSPVKVSSKLMPETDDGRSLPTSQVPLCFFLSFTRSIHLVLFSYLLLII